MTADILNFPGCSDTEPAMVMDFARSLGFVVALDQLDRERRGHIMAIWADTGTLTTAEYLVLQKYYAMKETPA